MVLEIKGLEDDQDRAKHEAAHQWVRAVNRWGELGQWAFLVCRKPEEVMGRLKECKAADWRQ